MIVLYEKLKKELLNILILLIIILIIFKIVFFKESIIIIFRILISLFFILISGFFIMYYWHEKLDFLTRLVSGSILAFALVGALSYYSGLIGIHVKYHGIILPLLLYIPSFILIFKKSQSKSNAYQ